MAASHSLHAPAMSATGKASPQPRRGHEQFREHGDVIGESLRDVWHQISNTVFDSYRPERHYMRGPGPACAAKRRNGSK